MKALAVIGANFGDEGKGLVTDYLCRNRDVGVVVRYNGGAQAGHTVDDGNNRHVFHHIGSGALCGVPTFLSQFFICNPLLFLKELEEFDEISTNSWPEVYAHPTCLITTYADMMINQVKEAKRGKDRHGSCGVGINQTVMRSTIPELKITMADLWNGVKLESVLTEICGKYSRFITGETVDVENGIEAFMKACDAFAEYVKPAGIEQCRNPLFEGAQGLLLDQDNTEFFPHVTRSKTGMHNVLLLCEQAGITEKEAYYVSRTYLTRHGAGPLPGEDQNMGFPDSTNFNNEWQGKLRFAPLDYDAMMKRTIADSVATVHNVALTHCDQFSAYDHHAELYSYGPTADDIEKEMR